MGYKKKHHIHNPYRSHKQVKESLLEATRKHMFVHMTNDEILERDKLWDEIYPSMKEKVSEDLDQIDDLGKDVKKHQIKEANANPNTRRLQTQSRDTGSYWQAELDRVFGKKS